MDEMQTVAAQGQVSNDAAVLYERYFVPALFRQWTEPMLRAVGLARGGRSGDRVLDIACGTGVLARAARECVGEAGEVIGIDPNEGMLVVAANEDPSIEWRRGRAESLPWADASFDVVTCQFGLMFFEDRAGALRESMRVLRPAGRLAVAVWDSVEHSPGFAQLVQLLERICGQAPADALRAPFSLGDKQALDALLRRAGITDATIRTHRGVARFPSLASWIHTNVRGWAFSDLVDDAQLAELTQAAGREMRGLVGKDGIVSFDTPAHIVSARKG